MANRRDFMAGTAALLLANVFWRGAAAAQEAVSVPQLRDLDSNPATSFYLNIVDTAYKAVYEESLASVSSYDELKAALAAGWSAYKGEMQEAVLALMPQLDDARALQTLANPRNFRLLHSNDTRHYDPSGMSRTFRGNPEATNFLYYRVRELVDAGIVTAQEGAGEISGMNKSGFYQNDLPAFLSEQAKIRQVELQQAPQAPTPSAYN